MQIVQQQVKQEQQVGPTTADGLVNLLKTKLGVTNPKVILVFDSNEGGGDEKTPLPGLGFPEGIKWKIHVFFNSPKPLQTANLDVPVVAADTPIKAQTDEVIKTVYPGGWIGWCGKINGQWIWIT